MRSAVHQASFSRACLQLSPQLPCITPFTRCYRGYVCRCSTHGGQVTRVNNFQQSWSFTPIQCSYQVHAHLTRFSSEYLGDPLLIGTCRCCVWISTSYPCIIPRTIHAPPIERKNWKVLIYPRSQIGYSHCSLYFLFRVYMYVFIPI